MLPLHAFRELEQHHILFPCCPAYHKRRGTPYWGCPPAHVLDPLKWDHPSGCAKPSPCSRRMWVGMDVWHGQPWLPLTTGHTLQPWAGPQSPQSPGMSGHLTVTGQRSFVCLTWAHTPSNHQVSTSHMTHHLC